MKCAVLLLLFAARPVFGALELYLPMTGRTGPARSVIDRAVRGMDGAIRRNDSDDEAASYVRDVPSVLAPRASTSLRVRGKTLVHLPGSNQMTMTGDFSISLWIKRLDSANGRQTILLRTGGWNLSYIRSRDEYVFEIQAGGKVALALPAPATGRWQHLVLVRKAEHCRLWLDGTPAGQAVPLPGALPGGGWLYIGAAATSGAHSLNAQLAELGIWSRALDAGDVARLAAGTTVLDIADPAKLTPVPTTPFPAEIAVVPDSAGMELVRDGRPRAVIAIQKDNRQPELASVVQQRLAAAWGVTFPIRELADHGDGAEDLILFGANNSNMLLRELTANAFLHPNTRGAELRAFPRVLDWNRGVVYFGGRSVEQVEQSIDRLLARYPRPAAMPLLAGLEHPEPPPDLLALRDEMLAIYADHDRNKADRVIAIMARLLEAYRDTGDDRCAGSFGDAVSLMLENYETVEKSHRNRPPTFVFHQVPRFVFLAETSPAFTARHRRDAAELMRLFMEGTMAFWEMAKPAVMYAQGQTFYLTNHYNFAARSTYDVCRYLLDRHDYGPARYWQAVANHVFAGVQDHPLSPEDAAGYHFLVYRIFTDHALASGRYSTDFFRNDSYREAVDFAKTITNHHGYVPGYGDANATGGASHYTLLRDALDILGDPECEYLLALIARRSGSQFHQETIQAMGLRHDLPPPADPRHLGLNAVELNAFLLQQHHRYPRFSRPVLNKAIFRSGWEDDASFLAINGLTSAPHGHDDAGGICQYINGDHLWLFEGHYINRHAEDHNVMNVIRDGVAPDRSRFFPTNRNMAAQILARLQTPRRDFALLSMLLENFNGVDHCRRIAWEKQGAFWVIDTAAVKKPGNYLFTNQFRTTGEIRDTPQGVLVTQTPGTTPNSPAHFAICEGTGSTKHRFARLETCHGRPNTVLPGYAYSDRTTKALLQRQEGTMQPGDTLRFVNFLTPLRDPALPVSVRQLAADAYLATDGVTHRLAVLGRLEYPGLLVDADSCFIGPEGLLAENARELVIAGRRLALGPDVATSLDGIAGLDRKNLDAILAQLADANTAPGEILPNRPAAGIDVPQTAFDQVLAFDHPISAIAIGPAAIAVGLVDGTVRLMDFQGTVCAEQAFGQGISAIAYIDAAKDSRWMVGVRGPRTTSVVEVTDAELHALDARGNRLWRQTLPFYARRYGDATTIFRAFLDGSNAAPAILVGCESWSYHAFSLDGRKLWQAQCSHGATSGTAGDLDGDGKDEIYAGNEYYTHTILDADGKMLGQVTRSPQDVDASLADLNRDGQPEVLVGSFDGFLYVHGLAGNPLVGRKVNVGGQPANIVLFDSGEHRAAAASRNGVVSFIGPGLERAAHLVLPAPALAMAAREERSYVAAVDGFVYELQGAVIRAKLPFQYDPEALQPPLARANDRLLALCSHNRLYLLR